MSTDQIVTFRLEDVFVPAQGGTVADTEITINLTDGLETFPNILPVASFVKDYLNNYPEENDLYEVISNNLSQALLDSSGLGLSGTVDEISVELEREPAGVLSFPFVSTSTLTPTADPQQVISIDLQDIPVPVQGGTVVDATIVVDYTDGLENFPSVIPLSNFVEDYLETYPNPDDLYENVSQNLVSDILDEPSLGFSGTFDSISVKLDREPTGNLPFPFVVQAIGQQGGATDQIVTFRLEDVFVPAQGGTVADTEITINLTDGLETFPNILPVASFVKDYLNNYPEENDLYEVISNNLSQALLDSSGLGLSGTVDEISVELEREPAGVLSFPFVSTSTVTPTADPKQVISIDLQDIPVPVQGGTVVDATIVVDYTDGLENFPSVIPLSNFVEDYLETYPNPDDLYENVSQNLVSDILNEPSLGFSGTFDSISVKLDREPTGNLPFPFTVQAIGEPSPADDDETLEGTPGPDVIDGKGGNDRIRGGRGNDSLSGGNGDDKMSGQGGDDILLGGSGDDTLYGEAGDDVINGGNGNDFILAWKGDDEVSGGAGSDIFVFSPGHGTDIITDFVVGEDRIGLKGGLTFTDLSVSIDGTKTEIAVGDETLAILNGVTNALTELDFVTI
jgi:RTX calcium-binding nonapeptide repeat (4 copies)